MRLSFVGRHMQCDKFKHVINHLILFVLISKSDEKSKTERKTKPKCAPDVLVTLENGIIIPD